MKANLLIQINEITVRDYTLIEDEGIGASLSNYPNLSSVYEDDGERPGKHMIVIRGKTLEDLFKYLDFVELPVWIMT
jgi:hypothetical protein